MGEELDSSRLLKILHGYNAVLLVDSESSTAYRTQQGTLDVTTAKVVPVCENLHGYSVRRKKEDTTVNQGIPIDRSLLLLR